jgi:hypothetical protein
LECHRSTLEQRFQLVVNVFGSFGNL